MKCRQVVSLIDPYLDRRLDSAGKAQFEEHIKVCSRCKEALWEKESFLLLLENDSKFKGPDNLTGDVMSAIFDLDMKKIHRKSGSEQYNYSLVFRRLGISMVISAAVMLFSLILPFDYTITTERAAIETTNEFAQTTLQLSNTLYDVNNSVKNFFRNINNSIEKYKEGY